MTQESTLLEFPCHFPIKIIGQNAQTMQDEITNIILKYFPDTPADKIKSTPSAKGNFISITASLYVLDKLTLDNLYKEVSKHPQIKMVL